MVSSGVLRAVIKSQVKFYSDERDSSAQKFFSSNYDDFQLSCCFYENTHGLVFRSLQV